MHYKTAVITTAVSSGRHDIQHNNTQHNAAKLSVANKLIMPRVVIPIVVMLNVMAPSLGFKGRRYLSSCVCDRSKKYFQLDWASK